MGREVFLSHRCGSQGLPSKLPPPSPLETHLGPRPSDAGPAIATVKLNGFISPQWPQFPPPPLDLGGVGGLEPVRGTGGPVQTTVLESGPEWVSGSPPPCSAWRAQLAGGRRTDPAPVWMAPSSEVSWTGLSCTCQGGETGKTCHLPILSSHTQHDINKKINSAPLLPQPRPL